MNENQQKELLTLIDHYEPGWNKGDLSMFILGNDFEIPCNQIDCNYTINFLEIKKAINYHHEVSENPITLDMLKYYIRTQHENEWLHLVMTEYNNPEIRCDSDDCEIIGFGKKILDLLDLCNND